MAAIGHKYIKNYGMAFAVGDGWEAIGPNYGFDSLAGAKLRCNAYMEDNRPEVVEEFDL